MRIGDKVFVNASSYSYRGTLRGTEGIVKCELCNVDGKFGVEIFGRTNQSSKYGYYYLDRSELTRQNDSELEYLKQDLNSIYGLASYRKFAIKNVYFNNPVTVVMWEDGTKTIVRCGDNDEYDPEKGLAMAISKKALGNKGNYYEQFKKWIPDMEHACDTCKHKNKFVLDQPCFECMVSQKPMGYEPINTKK